MLMIPNADSDDAGLGALEAEEEAAGAGAGWRRTGERAAGGAWGRGRGVGAALARSRRQGPVPRGGSPVGVEALTLCTIGVGEGKAGRVCALCGVCDLDSRASPGGCCCCWERRRLLCVRVGG